ARRTRCACGCCLAAVGPIERDDFVSWVGALARPEIVQLKSYEHAVWELGLERMHANELPWRAPGDESIAGLNRYPEPQPRELIVALGDLYGVSPACLLA